MFSHPWSEEKDTGGQGRARKSQSDAERGNSSSNIEKDRMTGGLWRIHRLNDHLKERSKALLEDRRGQRAEGAHGSRSGEHKVGNRGSGNSAAAEEGGSCEFNVALINRMEPLGDRPDLKAEPTFGNDRCVHVRMSAILSPNPSLSTPPPQERQALLSVDLVVSLLSVRKTRAPKPNGHAK